MSGRDYWDSFGQGPLELDAGMFLATIGRLRLVHPRLAGEVAQAERSFLAGIAGLVDERALAWHRAAALLRRARMQMRRQGDWQTGARSLLAEAMRFAEKAAG